MDLAGWRPTTLIDFPGRVAATLFTSGCNFRCPFCHNPELVLQERAVGLPVLDEQEILRELGRRHGFLDGVVLTGGEPTLQADLCSFAERVKALGFRVKLDTNGSTPDVVRALVEKRLVDYVAVDIKASPGRYREFAGIDAPIAEIEQTVTILKREAVDYEFRTTVAPGLARLDIEAIAEWVGPARRYVLQRFRVPQEGSKTLLDPSWALRDGLNEEALREAWLAIAGRFEDGGVRA